MNAQFDFLITLRRRSAACSSVIFQCSTFFLSAQSQIKWLCKHGLFPNCLVPDIHQGSLLLVTKQKVESSPAHISLLDCVRITRLLPTSVAFIKASTAIAPICLASQFTINIWWVTLLPSRSCSLAIRSLNTQSGPSLGH